MAEEEENTLIIVRRTPTAARTAFAGVISKAFSVQLAASMAAFKKEIVFSRPFGRWELVAMVEAQDGCQGTVRGAGCEEEPEPQSASYLFGCQK